MKTSYRALIAILMLAVATTTSAGAGINAKSNPDDISGSKQITYPGTNGDVYAIVEDASGNIIVGGDFNQAGNIETNNIACWHPSTSTWSSLGTGLGLGVYEADYVYSLAVDNLGNVYAGGVFTHAGSVEVNHIAKWDGTAWSALGTGMNSTVVALLADAGGNLYAGGPFTTAGGVAANRIAKWNGSVWSALGTGMAGVTYPEVIALAMDGSGNLYAGGDFTTAGGVAASRIAKWDGAAWSALGTGMNRNPETRGVEALAVDSLGNVYAGGDFTIAGGVTVKYIAKWDGIEWSAVGAGMDGWVYALAVDGSGHVYAGGGFMTAGGVPAYIIAEWDGTAWSALARGLYAGWPYYGACVYAIELDGLGNIYAGGFFTEALNEATSVVLNNIAKWDGTKWSALVLMPPYVSGVTPTNDTTPTWRWSSNGYGNGTFRYQLNGTDGAWTETTNKAYTPASPLTEGEHTLYVQEQNDNGNWSESASFTITVDLTPPAAPSVSSSGTPRDGLPDITNSPHPVWSWMPGGGGNGTYRYQLDGTDEGGWTETTDIAFAPADPLAEGVHTMYVQERDEAGNWSESGERAVEIDTTNPNPPVVSAPARTSSLRPMWTWDSGGNGNGTYRYQLDSEDEAGWTVTMALAFVPESDLAEGSYTLYVQERDDASNWSASGSATVSVEPNAPGAPVVTSPAVTNNPQPTWTWVSGGGAGNYRYQLDSEAGDWTATTETSFTLDPLDEGFHTLYVQEASATEVWSASGSSTTLVDFTAPNAPVVTGPGITADATPTWSWTPDGGGNGTFRYQLDSTTGAWTETTDTQFTPDANLGTGPHILFVEERDDAGNWSASGSWTIVIAPNAPNPPVVSGVSPTADTTPTWTWTSGGGGNGAFRYQLDATGGAWTQTTNTTYTSASPLSEGPHTLYVQESNTVGDWSVSGSFTIVVVSASSVDSDSDGLTDAEEAAIGTNPENPDTDGDGMDDGYEHAHGLDPLNPEDAFLDTDSDGFTNFEEYLLRSDPLDPDSPRDTFFISAEGGVDVSTGGTESAPWRTINYALDQVAPAEQVPVTLVILPGTYYEGVALKPHVMLAGAESQEKPLIAGSVIAAASTELRRLALAPVQLATSGTLLDITSVEVVVKEVDFSGAGFTGIRFNSPNGTGALIEECVFSGLGTGIELLDALPTIRRCVFDGISADAIVVRAQMSGEKAEGNGSLGEEGNANSGYNTFAATIDGYAVINERTDESLVMEINDWDTDDLTEIAGRIGGTGDVDFDPPLTKGAGIMAASVFCSVWNAADKSPIDNASAQLSPGAFNPVTQNSAGVYTFACVIPGDWTFTVSAPACTDASQSAHVEAAETKNLLFPMQSSTPTEGEGEDEDDDNPPPGCFGG